MKITSQLNILEEFFKMSLVTGFPSATVTFNCAVPAESNIAVCTFSHIRSAIIHALGTEVKDPEENIICDMRFGDEPKSPKFVLVKLRNVTDEQRKRIELKIEAIRFTGKFNPVITVH